MQWAMALALVTTFCVLQTRILTCVAVMIRASHRCMSLRAVNQPQAVMETTHFTGVFASDDQWRERFLRAVQTPSADP